MHTRKLRGEEKSKSGSHGKMSFCVLGRIPHGKRENGFGEKRPSNGSNRVKVGKR